MTTSKPSGIPAPGWYYADGDAADTMRYWDGETWQGEPQPIATVPGSGVPAAPKTMPARLEAGSPWQRIVGRLIDLVLMIVPFFGLVFLLDQGDEPNPVGLVFMFGLMAGIAIYDLVLVGLFAATAGKAAMGLRVVGPTGELANWGVAAKRWMLILVVLAPMAGLLAVLVIGVVSLVFLFTDPRRQTVQDRVAGSFVVTMESIRQAQANGRLAVNA